VGGVTAAVVVVGYKGGRVGWVGWVGEFFFVGRRGPAETLWVGMNMAVWDWLLGSGCWVF